MRFATRFRCSILLAVCVLAAGTIPARGQGPQHFTLEQVLSAPFASELVASPSGGKVAWMENVLGARNVWIAEPPAYKGRQVTRFVGDSGKYLVQLMFTPDGNSIVFVRGGAHSGRRLPDPPNPSLDPSGGKEEVWIANVATGNAVRVDDGTWPAVAPRGNLVAYLKHDEIWGAPLTKNATGTVAGTPRVLFKDRGTAAPQGNATSLRWSPKGNRLAFISLRDQHNFIGVYDADANTLQFLDPSTDRDQWPIWSPDGTSIAFVREPSAPAPAAGREGGGGRRATLPWSIRVADARTGKGHELWRAVEGMGAGFGFGFFNNDRQLFWGAEDRIVFPWERSGWAHMYSIPASGGQPTDLTPGTEFEAEHVALAPNGRDIVFMSNQGDIDRRHLWRVPITGGTPQSATAGTGVEYWPVFTSDGAGVAFQATTAKTPPHVELFHMRDVTNGPVAPSARQLLATGVTPKQFPGSALVEPQQVIFPSLDGWQIHGQLYLPPDYKSTEHYPALIYLHGGPNSQMVLGYHYHRFDYYQKPYGLIQYLANHGYMVLSVNYRKGTGYGVKFREPPNPTSANPREHPDVIDIIGGGLYLKGRPDVDPNRVGIFGGSAGGQRTVLGLTYGPDIFSAGFDLHGVALPVLGKTDTWKAPVIIVHGDDDRNVPFVQTVQLVSELRSHGVDVELLVIPNEIHSFLRHESWLRAFEAAADFLDRKLKNRPASARTGDSK